MQSFLPWVICGIASLFFFYEFVQITVFNSIANQIMEKYLINATELSNLSSMYYYINVILLIPAGILLDRYSTKLCLVSSMGISIFGTLIFILSSSIAFAAFGRAISGIGGAFSFIGCVSLIIKWIPPKKAAFAISCLVTVGFAGGIAAQVPFTLISSYMSLEHSLELLVFVGLFFWLLIICFVKDSPSESKNTIYIFTLLKLLLAVLKNKQTWFCAWYISLMNLPILILAALWSNLYLTEGNHLSSVQASVITSLLFVGIAVGSPLVGWAADKFARKKIIMLSGAVLSFLTLILITHINADALVLALLFFTLGFCSSSQCLGYPAIVRNNPPEATAVVSSIASIVVLGGGAILKVIFGMILDSSWSGGLSHSVRVYSRDSFNSGLTLLLCCFVLSAVFSLLIKESE